MVKKKFKLHAPFPPGGDQPQAVAALLASRPGVSTLVGVTGSGKTFTMAQVIAQQEKPVVILSPNKTLAAQLYEEFALFFPENKVCYFVSYYDYYQPESYLPAQDIYIPKETKVNSELERLRIEATASIINRTDTIIITSVSCIYSLGNPHDYRSLAFSLHLNQKIKRQDLIHKLIFIQYKRNDVEKSAGTFQVMGNSIEVQLPYQREKLHIEIFGDKIESLQWLDRHNNSVLRDLEDVLIFPAKHFVTTEEKKETAIHSILQEVNEWAPQVPNPLYQERIRQRVQHDVEMIQEIGHCSGIENYSVHFDGRSSGEQPYCLFDFFENRGFLLIIDESHIALPQLRGMYAGDRSRKKALIEYGFRLPSAFDNRPLTFEEIEGFFNDVIFVSATPGAYELEKSSAIVEQIIRPTGLTDPNIIVHPRLNQLDHLVEQIKNTRTAGFRSLVMVMTKKLAEEMARFLQEKGISVCYLHSEIKTPQRTELLQKLRLGVFDCLVGVNLLREGIDLPEVALVAIMDADVESFLRDKRSLIQIIGRAARNTEAYVVLYADTITTSMKNAMDETNRRRTLQQDYNRQHGITPTTVKREVTKSISPMQKAIAEASQYKKKPSKDTTEQPLSDQEIRKKLYDLEEEMRKAADAFDFEKAIKLREEWFALQKQKQKDS